MNCGNAVSKSSFSVASAGSVSGHSWTAQEADNAIAASEAVIIFNAFLIYPPPTFLRSKLYENVTETLSMHTNVV